MGRATPTSAETILADFGIVRPEEIDLPAICAANNILLQERPLSSMEAYIVARADGTGHSLITVNSRSPLARRRFSIGHELGHWYLHRHVGHICTSADIGAGDDAGITRQARARERAADRFAADLLMPRSMIVPKVRPRNRITCGLLQELAAEFSVSIEAIARRCAEINTHPVMVIVTNRNRKSRLLARSRDLDSKLWPNALLASESVASSVLEGGLSPSSGWVSAEAWFDGEALDRCSVFEDSIRYGDGVLSVLSIEDDRLLSQ